MTISIDTIKQKILDQAMRGNLVEQDPNDEPADILLEKITTEKEILIKEKKIKKQKSLTPIEKDETPYDLPKGWGWFRLGDICINRDAERIPLSVHERENQEKIFDYYGASGVIDKVDSYLFDKPLLLIGEDGANLLRRSTPIAFIANGKYWVNNHAHVLDSIDRTILDFLSYYINSINLSDYITGTAQPKLNQANLNKILIPVPPLAEQKRMITKIEELFSLCNKWRREIEKQQKYLSVLRKKLLDNSMRGLLVEHNLNDEPVGLLLERIKEKREGLTKEKKIKKQETLSPIEENEIPYPLPENWEWVKLGDICNQIHYGYTASATEENTGVKMVRITDIQDNKVIWENVPFCIIDRKNIDKYTLQDNDILIARTGGTVGKSFIVNKVSYTSVFASYLLRVQVSNQVNPKYIKYFLESQQYWTQLYDKTSGTGQPNVNSTALKNLILPLPPLEVQKQIVDKLNDLFSHFENLELKII